MKIEATTLGLLLYAALLGYSLASLASSFKLVKLSGRLFTAAFLFNAAALALRWHEVGQLPMQTMFEVFLWLSMLIYPISIFTKKITADDTRQMDIFIAILIIFPAAFVFDSSRQPLPPALQSWHFAPHVGCYLLGYVLMFKAAAVAAKSLWMGKECDNLYFNDAAHKLVSLGFVPLTAGLVLGSMWAKVSWGRFWGWDPKELWALATWLTFALYFILKHERGEKYPKTCLFLVILGMFFIILTLLWVNLSRVFDSIHSYA